MRSALCHKQIRGRVGFALNIILALTVRGLLATAGTLLGRAPEPAIPPRNPQSLLAFPYRAGASQPFGPDPRAPGCSRSFSLLGSVAAKAQRREDKCATVKLLVHSRASVRMILAPGGSFPLGALSLPVID